MFATYLAEPLCDIINTSVRWSEYPEIYKFEVSTPVPKQYPRKTNSEIRNISYDKIMVKLLAELMIMDMKPNFDPAQYGKRKGISIQYYLIDMIHRILKALDNYSRGDIFAVIVS